MNNRRAIICFLTAGLLASCSPRVYVDITNSREPRKERSAVAVLNEETEPPVEAELLGDLSVERGYSDEVIIIPGGAFVAWFSQEPLPRAKEEVRRAGGNVLKLKKANKDWGFGYQYIEGQVYYLDGMDGKSLRKMSTLNIKRYPDYPLKKFDINIGLGGETFYATNEFLLGVMDVWYEGPNSVKSMYANCYDVTISPTLSIEWAYNLNKQWAVVGSVGVNRAQASYFDPFTDAELRHETLYGYDILAGARYHYVRKQNYSLYSQVMLGATFHTKGEYWKHNELANNHFGWQITGLGITGGNRLYGFGEFGWGTEYVAIGMITGMRFGFGYRF